MSAPRQGCYMGKKGIMNPLMGSETATAFNSESKRDHGAVNGISNGYYDIVLQSQPVSRKDQLLCQQKGCSSERPATYNSGPLTCLRTIFPNDEQRRKYFPGILREKFKDSEVRKNAGFPIGSDEDILAMLRHPYYTA